MISSDSGLSIWHQTIPATLQTRNGLFLIPSSPNQTDGKTVAGAPGADGVKFSTASSSSYAPVQRGPICPSGILLTKPATDVFSNGFAPV
jgi:hypothetical protein